MSGTNYDDAYRRGAWKVGGGFAAFLLVLVGLVILVCVLVLGGCVAYRDEDTGSVGLGMELAKLPETAGQFGRAVADWLPPPFNYIAGGALTLIGGGGGASLIRRSAEKRAERARREADAAWDEASTKSELAAARRDAAFDEGTQRAAPAASVSVAPLVAGVPAPNPATVVASGVAPSPAGA